MPIKPWTSPDYITTGLSKTWVKFPILNGLLKFKVRAKQDAFIALTTWPLPSRNMVQIYLGGQNNTVSGMFCELEPYRRIEVQTKGILSSDELKEFWIIWINGEVFVLNAGEKHAFMSLKYQKYPIHYVGICTGERKGTWFFKDDERIETYYSEDYIFHGIRQGYIEVACRADSNVHIALMSTGCIADPMVELIFGHDQNSKTSLKVNGSLEAEYDTPDILTPEKYTKFCIGWRNGNIWVMKESPRGPLILAYKACIDFVAKFCAIRTTRKSLGSWVFRMSDNNKPPVRSKNCYLDNNSYHYSRILVPLKG